LAAIDPDIDDLLSALLATPLAFLAQAVIEAIVDETPDAFEDRLSIRDGEPFHFERRTRHGQLDLAHRIISGRIKREIRMLQQVRRLAPELRLTSVSVLPLLDVTEARARRPSELLDPGREAALAVFLETWSGVQAELRQRWEASDAG
jgi:hypothetical protein